MMHRKYIYGSGLILKVVQLLLPHGLVVRQATLPMGFFRREYWSGCCHFLLQGIFLTQGLNLSLLHCRQILFFIFSSSH